MKRIDAHIHWNGDDVEWMEVMDEYDLRLINICVAQDDRGSWRESDHYTRARFETNPERFAWITTFDLPRLPDKEYADRVIAGLKTDFEAGAIACKVWKNFGMELKTPAGEWMMVDDPLLDPILDFLARESVPLVAHIGEPLACWQPLGEDNPHTGYYSLHPEWHFYTRTDVPSHGEIIAARDRMLANHPDLRVIGAHFGSLEYDVVEIARRLDRYPNFAVDTSARMRDIALQDDTVVRAFIESYSDRVLWGTDMVGREAFSGMTKEVRAERLARARARYDAEFAYYEGDGAGQGLDLPVSVLERIYWKNALEWYPRLTEQWS